MDDVIGFYTTNPLGRDLSGGWCYPTHEMPVYQSAWQASREKGRGDRGGKERDSSSFSSPPSPRSFLVPGTLHWKVWYINGY